MSKKNGYWLNALNIRPNEWWLVKKLFIMQFMQGAGIAFFFTASFTLFLHEVGITKLPYVFIYSSALLWVTGFFYSRLEHKYEIGKLAIIVTVFIAVSMLLFRLAFAYGNGEWFLYGMLAWFNVLYLLNNLEFWGLAAVLFDVRQSKRLFSVISAGDIPAKFIGYTLALLTVEYIGTINLLWAGVLCMLASVPFLISIKKSANLLEHNHANHGHQKHSDHKITTLAENFAGNTLIRRLAIITIIVSACFIIINYAFYAGIKEAYKDDISLARFIALFMAVSRIIAMGVKTVLTGRLISRLGIIKSLMITPVIMILMIIMVLIVRTMPGNEKIIFYLFGATAIAIDILRSAISTPVFITIMQPLPTHERLRAHNILKGIMDPFASLFTGLLLLVLIQYQPHADLTNIYYILLALGILWIIGNYRVNKEYLKTIINTISSNYFNLQNFSIDDSDTVKWVKEKVVSGTEMEVINILKMLDATKSVLFNELVVSSLQHASEKIKTAAIQLIQQKNIPVEKDILLQVLASNSGNVKASALQTLCKTGVDYQLVLPYLNDVDASIKTAAITGLINYGDGIAKETAGACLQQLVHSALPADRINAAGILANLHQYNSGWRILQMLPEADNAVRKAVLMAAGKTRDSLLLDQIIAHLATDEPVALQSLFLAGENALPFIKSTIADKNTPQLLQEKLIYLAGRISGSKAHELLIGLLTNKKELYKPIAKALFRSHYSTDRGPKIYLEGIARELLAHSAAIVYMQNVLLQNKDKYQVLINAMQIELCDLRDALLNIFAVLYDREKISKVRTAYNTGKKINILNALEIIEMLVRKDLALHFNVINEPGEIANRMAELHELYPDPFFKKVEQVLINILADETWSYHYWTMACSLYTAGQQQHNVGRTLVEKYALAENILLRETALFVKLTS
ncbi:MFS transporter [Ferruginibacter paludis]|uniref:MFS transporter n=1 Tax=Ferruginibacter paludis TaxID=1310417 RepID=UPI0025B3EA1B|nr:MFS transporter [Ferruginibacter paludis]MDN3659121.1 MFS transporter [Ferruginibacter paludis]